MDENNTQEGQALFAIEDAGHEYILPDLAGQEDNQILRFVKKEKREDGFYFVHGGTTNEAVISVLIDRIACLNRHVPSEHNEVAIDRLNDALRALNMRTAERVERGVEGTHTA